MFMSSERLVIGPNNQLLNGMLHNPEERGWHFVSGDPELWKYADRFVKPDGKALDLGIGFGRNGLPLALWGMNVVGYDLDTEAAEDLETIVGELSESLPVSLEVRIEDMFKAELGKSEYDLAVLAELVHVPSKAEALDLFDKAYDALKPGGHMWIRMASKESEGYKELILASEEAWGPTMLDGGNVIEDYCICTGEEKLEPVLFMDQGDLVNYFAGKQAKIIHSQSIPQVGRWNMMFGEDFNPSNPAKGTMVSALAQKPMEF